MLDVGNDREANNRYVLWTFELNMDDILKDYNREDDPSLTNSCFPALATSKLFKDRSKVYNFLRIVNPKKTL